MPEAEALGGSVDEGTTEDEREVEGEPRWPPGTSSSRGRLTADTFNSVSNLSSDAVLMLTVTV